jgi:hypothetical protein
VKRWEVPVRRSGFFSVFAEFRHIVSVMFTEGVLLLPKAVSIYTTPIKSEVMQDPRNQGLYTSRSPEDALVHVELMVV